MAQFRIRQHRYEEGLDLSANVRLVSVPKLGIDWTFFRQNTEGSYALGSDGFFVSDNLTMDFCIVTQ